MSFDTRIFGPGNYQIDYVTKPFTFIFCQHKEHIMNNGTSSRRSFVFSGWVR